jgi:hypothetical protein
MRNLSGRLLRFSVLRAILVVALALFGGQSLKAQYFFELDPGDASTYRTWTEKNWQYAVKLNMAMYAGQTVHHTINHASEVPTPTVDPMRSNGPGSFWGIRVPEWVKGAVANPFTGAGVSGMNETLTRMFSGLSAMQKARAVLKTAGLVRATLMGLRFNVNAWQMLSNIASFENTNEDGTKMGAVTFSVVPKGKGTLDEIEKFFKDDPLWNNPKWQNGIKVSGPTGLLSYIPVVEPLDDTGVQRQAGEGDGDTVNRWLEAVDRGARIATEEIAALRAYSGKKQSQAMRDSMSPRMLAKSMKDAVNKGRDKWRAVERTRALLEGRTVAEITSEYDNLRDAMLQEADHSYAQAELHSTFYLNLQNQADNIVAPLINQGRQDDISALEKAMQQFISDNEKDQLGDMVNDLVKKVFPNLVSFIPPTPTTKDGTADTAMQIPFVGLITNVVDVALITSGADPNSSAKDGASPVTAMLKEYQTKVLALRMGYHLWEELKACRQLVTVRAQRDMAARGIKNDKTVESAYKRANALAKEREVGLTQLQFFNGKVGAWLQVKQ